jgi:hypothetical protein
MKHPVAFGLLAVLLPAAAPALRAASLTYSQPTLPCMALENTTGNTCLITLTNTNPSQLAYVTNISAPSAFIPYAGESDDQAINPALVAPNPTAQNPLIIALSGGTANIKFSWDAVDYIMDNDVDSGSWVTSFDITYNYGSGSNMTLHALALVQVNDPPRGTPEPAAFITIGLGLVALGGCRFRPRRPAPSAQPK